MKHFYQEHYVATYFFAIRLFLLAWTASHLSYHHFRHKENKSNLCTTNPFSTKCVYRREGTPMFMHAFKVHLFSIHYLNCVLIISVCSPLICWYVKPGSHENILYWICSPLQLGKERFAISSGNILLRFCFERKKS